jgi:hypothetical protein
MAEKDVHLKQVLKRLPPGDRWTPTDKDQTLLGGCVTTNETPKKPCCKTEKKC